MPQAIQTGEFNTFVGGLVTEASPLTFPENASLDEDNFVLNRDGSRQRRLGMDVISGLTPEETTTPFSYTGVGPVGETSVSSYLWKDPGGTAGKEFIALQVHSNFYILDRADDTLKANSYVKYRLWIEAGSGDTVGKFSFTSVGGRLVWVVGFDKFVRVLSYDKELDRFSFTTEPLKVRDLFGVAASYNGRDLFDPNYLNYRPDTTDEHGQEEHMYNLRNQGWALPRVEWEDSPSPPPGLPIKGDPVKAFQSYGVDDRGLPSNADSPAISLYANTDSVDKVTERFNDQNAYRYEPPNAKVASGHFIIDLFERGASRKEEYEEVTNTTTGKYINANPDPTLISYVNYRTPTVTLPTDKTEGGASVVAEFAGRVWYGGFSDKVVDGDSRSPNLSSYICYSQQVEHKSQIGRCYQEGDPTDTEAPDRLDTDGGFVVLSGVKEVKQMINVGSGLMVLASNGVWFISGSDSGEFNANNQSVSKLTEHGVTSAGSVVLVEGSVIYWAQEGIMQIAPTQVGGYAAQEISGKIRTFYAGIDGVSKEYANGDYDWREKKVRWVYDNLISDTAVRELVLDLTLGSFYTATIGSVSQEYKVMMPIRTSSTLVGIKDFPVLVGADDVLSDTDTVVSEGEGRISGFEDMIYLTLINPIDTTRPEFTFASYNNTNFKDWESVDGTGVDAAAYLLTGYIGTGDNHKFKQVPYIYFHFLTTESGFTDGVGDYIITNESSCKVSSQWDWTNSANAGKWGKEFQAYRYRRAYIPDEAEPDEYDSGHKTIVSKNKLRGRGRVVSLRIATEEGKDMKLLGWSMNIASNRSV